MSKTYKTAKNENNRNRNQKKTPYLENIKIDKLKSFFFNIIIYLRL